MLGSNRRRSRRLQPPSPNTDGNNNSSGGGGRKSSAAGDDDEDDVRSEGQQDWRPRVNRALAMAEEATAPDTSPSRNNSTGGGGGGGDVSLNESMSRTASDFEDLSLSQLTLSADVSITGGGVASSSRHHHDGGSGGGRGISEAVTPPRHHRNGDDNDGEVGGGLLAVDISGVSGSGSGLGVEAGAELQRLGALAADLSGSGADGYAHTPAHTAHSTAATPCSYLIDSAFWPDLDLI